MSRASLEERLRLQARMCSELGSPLTAALITGAADDLRAGGVVRDLFDEEERRPPGSVPALRLAGALHRLVLERRAPELALHYPSVGGTAAVEDAWEVAERTCRAHLDELRLPVRRTVQTNEVGRAAVLWGALCRIGGPVRLLELGSSAGLNLRVDRFAYEVAEGVVLGEAGSPVRLVRPWEGTHPSYDAPEVVDRRGCDPDPLDPASAEDRLTLTSYVWADQTARFERLRAALSVAAEVPAVVERAGALAFLQRQLADLPDDATTVVWHSVVMQYVDPDERRAVDALLHEVGRHAGPRLVRVSLEPEQVSGGTAFRVREQRWPSGERVHVADAQGHGPPVVWR